MVRTSRKIPNGWESYNPIGLVIEGTRIFAFKTPLYCELQKQVQKSKQFTTSTLLRKMAEHGKSLGLVINCSNTRRYYDKQDIEGMAIEYKELPCPGRGFLVRTDLVKDFIIAIDEFLSRNKDNGLLIGVHCSDGINRSGYLICNYLICKHAWSSHAALNEFEKARGYPIQSGSYIQAIHKADSDRRHKNLNLQSICEEDNQPQIKTSLKRRASDDETDIQPEVTAQLMHQFYQLEQQFKQAATSVISEPIISMPRNQVHAEGFSTHETAANSNGPLSQEPDSMEGDDDSDDNDAGCEEGSSPNIDYESMGRVDLKDPPTKSSQRRQRRQKREKMFSVMKKGRFWEINEMQKQIQK